MSRLVSVAASAVLVAVCAQLSSAAGEVPASFVDNAITSFASAVLSVLPADASLVGQGVEFTS